MAERSFRIEGRLVYENAYDDAGGLVLVAMCMPMDI